MSSKFKPGMLVEYRSSLDHKIMLILSFESNDWCSRYHYFNIETLKVGQFDVSSQVEEKSREISL